jgi:hypothetical protein
MPIIVTSDPVWGDDETRADAHQYRIKAYTINAKNSEYIQRFEYESSNKYPGDKDVLALEKPTILARLKGAAGN